MPKVKKIRASALESQQARHEPLGQVIEGDQVRGKYAAPIREGRKRRDSSKNKADEEYLDPKTTKRILQMTREHELEEEAGVRREYLKQHHQQPNKSKHHAALDSDEEEEEDMEEAVFDQEDEYVQKNCSC